MEWVSLKLVPKSQRTNLVSNQWTEHFQSEYKWSKHQMHKAPTYIDRAATEEIEMLHHQSNWERQYSSTNIYCASICAGNINLESTNIEQALIGEAKWSVH